MGRGELRGEKCASTSSSDIRRARGQQSAASQADSILYGASPRREANSEEAQTESPLTDRLASAEADLLAVAQQYRALAKELAAEAALVDAALVDAENEMDALDEAGAGAKEFNKAQTRYDQAYNASRDLDARLGKIEDIADDLEHHLKN